MAGASDNGADPAPSTEDGRPVGEAGSPPVEDKPVETEAARAAELDKVQRCLEDLLSKHNLAEDAFIQQHMNTQMYVPLCILAGHHGVATLGRGIDVATMLEVARRSDKLDVDEEQLMVRPVLKPRRNTLILHDLPEEVGEQELRQLFEGSPESESLCSVKPDVNNTAFATFQTDEAAQRAALWLRSQSLHGAGVKCAVKAEHVLRSFFPAVPGTPPCGMSMAPYGVSGQQVVWSQMQPWSGQWQGTGAASAQCGPSMDAWGDGKGGCDTGDACAVKGKGKFKDGGAKGRGGKAKGKGKGKRKGEGPPPSAGVELGQVEEPLEPVGDGTVVDDSELGYAHKFRRYTREQIIEICSGLDDLIKPEGFTRFESEEKDVALFRDTPYKDWAPLPTPQITFASGAFPEGRKGTGDAPVPGSPLVDGLGGPPPRKGSAMSRSSWSSSRRSASAGRGHADSGEPDAWAGSAAWGNSEWDEWCSDTAWSKGAEHSRWRRRGSSWNDWCDSSQQWAEETTEDQRGPKRMSWAEKARGAAEGGAGAGAPQRWQVRKGSSAAPDHKEEQAPPSQKEEEAPSGQGKEGAAEQQDGGSEAAPAASLADQKASASEAVTPEQPLDTPEVSAPAAAAKSHAPTWAERVKLGGAPKSAPKPAVG